MEIEDNQTIIEIPDANIFWIYDTTVSVEPEHATYTGIRLNDEK